MTEVLSPAGHRQIAVNANLAALNFLVLFLMTANKQANILYALSVPISLPPGHLIWQEAARKLINSEKGPPLSLGHHHQPF